MQVTEQGALAQLSHPSGDAENAAGPGKFGALLLNANIPVYPTQPCCKTPVNTPQPLPQNAFSNPCWQN